MALIVATLIHPRTKTFPPRQASPIPANGTVVVAVIILPLEPPPQALGTPLKETSANVGRRMLTVIGQPSERGRRHRHRRRMTAANRQQMVNSTIDSPPSMSPQDLVLARAALVLEAITLKLTRTPTNARNLPTFSLAVEWAVRAALEA
ncbi:hypothetical protein MSAN_01828400 [Mycena sanguinolenta]|uniref:Uncharacterized protein n=1 Tax=Mycena sanguinolenta TaxID=230812 RepID=A0A8H6XTH7_9AGAR|nr:hypothetical protein MSAN_01828400 [Mycena sanguinolenta]